MKRRPPWKDLIRSASRQAMQILRSTKQSAGPVAVRHLIGQLPIQQVVFQPLLGDGGLSKVDDQYVIYAKTPADEVEKHFTLYAGEGDGATWLPGRVRFTLAHEVSHVIFAELLRPYGQDEQVKPSDLPTLESACNRLAADLLVPPDSLRQLAKPFSTIDPSCILAWARHYAVSPVTLLLQLQQSGIWGSTGGIAAVVREREHRLTIRAIVKQKMLDGIFPQACRDADIGTLVPENCDLNLYGGHRTECTLSIPIKTGNRPARQDFLFQCLKIARQPETFIVVVHRVGKPTFLKDT